MFPDRRRSSAHALLQCRQQGIEVLFELLHAFAFELLAGHVQVDAHAMEMYHPLPATELLAKIPSINAAMFTTLPPGSRLGAHRDPFAGSLRYPLGLVTPHSPTVTSSSMGRHDWQDGPAVMFDETLSFTVRMAPTSPA
jgi:aspartyl/asparaginyl beta-hydroxylase (cupin superfamily)